MVAKAKAKGDTLSPLMSADEVAAFLGIDRATVWRWVSAGKLKARKIGPKTTRFRREDLEKLVEGGRA